MINGPVTIRISTFRGSICHRLDTTELAIGDGWVHILRDMLDALDANGTPIACGEVYRSSGGKLVVWDWVIVGPGGGNPDAVTRADLIVEEAMIRSTHTCEICGTNHQVERQLAIGHYVYRCAECWSRRLP